ncbi:cupin domain-containing protein [Gemmobacter denitrificans]|uniref:Cupin domain-containing protein n=1 Tax=Gemmobacter denitrificans TaxID=3123040 RepID=A0ABU8BYC9_9RHOB
MSDMVFRLPAPGPEPLLTDLEGWIKVEGTPMMKTWVQHTSLDGSVISGTWEASPGTWHASYKFYEFVHLIEGQITITPDGGDPVTLRPGDGFVVEPGFKGTWKIEAPVRKHFCIKLK